MFATISKFRLIKILPQACICNPANKSILLRNISVEMFYKNQSQNTNITHDKAEKLEMLAKLFCSQNGKPSGPPGSTCSQACWVWREYLCIHIS